MAVLRSSGPDAIGGLAKDLLDNGKDVFRAPDHGSQFRVWTWVLHNS